MLLGGLKSKNIVSYISVLVFCAPAKCEYVAITLTQKKGYWDDTEHRGLGFLLKNYVQSPA